MNMEAKEKILRCVEEKRDEVVDLCSRMVQIPSVNPVYGGDTTDIASFVKQYLEDRGADVETHNFGSGTVCLTSTLKGAAEEPRLILYGHMDVVPIGDVSRWSFPPFSGEIRNGRVLGRGALDMKGGLASVMTAYLAFHEADVAFEGALTFVAAPDEEKWIPIEDGQGTQWWLLKTGKLRGDACIMGEPTGLGRIPIGDRGEYWIKVTTRGVPAHGTVPILGENAIEKMMKALEAILRITKERIQPPPDLAEVIEESKPMVAESMAERGFKGKVEEAMRMLDHVTVNIGEIQGGTMTNVVPDRCEAKMTIVMPQGYDREKAKRKMEALLTEAGLSDVSIERFSGPMAGYPTYMKPTEKVVQVVQKNARELLNITPSTYISLGAGDSQVYRRMGIPTIDYGPGGSGSHMYDESVLAEDLPLVAKVYAGAITDFLKAKS